MKSFKEELTDKLGLKLKEISTEQAEDHVNFRFPVEALHYANGGSIFESFTICWRTEKYVYSDEISRVAKEYYEPRGFRCIDDDHIMGDIVWEKDGQRYLSFFDLYNDPFEGSLYYRFQKTLR